MPNNKWADLTGEERDAGWRILGGYALVREEPESDPEVIGGSWSDAAQPPESNGLHGLTNKNLASRDAERPDVWKYQLNEDGRQLFEAQVEKNKKSNKG
jgi:hypothetical protein